MQRNINVSLLKVFVQMQLFLPILIEVAQKIWTELLLPIWISIPLINKFDPLIDQIKGNVDVHVISEAKLDESFPVGQFTIPGFSFPFSRDCNQ